MEKAFDSVAYHLPVNYYWQKIEAACRGRTGEGVVAGSGYGLLSFGFSFEPPVQSNRRRRRRSVAQPTRESETISLSLSSPSASSSFLRN